MKKIIIFMSIYCLCLSSINAELSSAIDVKPLEESKSFVSRGQVVGLDGRIICEFKPSNKNTPIFLHDQIDKSPEFINNSCTAEQLRDVVELSEISYNQNDAKIAAAFLAAIPIGVCAALTGWGAFVGAEQALLEKGIKNPSLVRESRIFSGGVGVIGPTVLTGISGLGFVCTAVGGTGSYFSVKYLF